MAHLLRIILRLPLHAAEKSQSSPRPATLCDVLCPHCLWDPLPTPRPLLSLWLHRPPGCSWSLPAWSRRWALAHAVLLVLEGPPGEPGSDPTFSAVPSWPPCPNLQAIPSLLLAHTPSLLSVPFSPETLTLSHVQVIYPVRSPGGH